MIKKDIKYYENKMRRKESPSKDERYDDYMNLGKIYKDDDNTDLLITHCKYRMKKKFNTLFYSLSFDYDLEDLLNMCKNRKLNFHQVKKIENLVDRFHEMATEIELCLYNEESSSRLQNICNTYENIVNKNDKS